MRLARKLWLVILGLLGLMLVVAIWGQFSTRAATDQTARLVAHYEASITTAVRWRGLAELATAMTLSRAKVSDPALRTELEGNSVEISKRISSVQEEINKNARSERDKAVLAEVAKLRVTVLDNRSQMKKFEQAGDQAGLLAFVDSQYKPTQLTYLGTIDKYIAEQVAQRDEALKALDAAEQQHVLISGISVFVVFVLGVWLTRGLIRSITQPLDRAVAVAQAISAGDLTQDLRSERLDEIGQLLQALSGMNERLRSLVSQVRTGVDSVSTASTQIATGNQDLSARTEQTASNLQQTAASMQELTSTVVRSVDTAQQANQLVTQAAQSATRGGDVMSRVVDSMRQIDGSSKKINDIIGVIDSIAFQTNILALNAAVEAARAGEQGRGFAVVAGEVRMLAQRSAEAAKEIKKLIGESVSSVDTGSKQVDEAGQAMGEIVTSVRRVSDLIGEITGSATEQRDGIDQVNQAVANLDQMTQQNAALVEESAAAAAALRDQAQRLAEVVAVFNVGSEMSSHASAAPARVSPRASRPEPVTLMPKSTPRLAHAAASTPVPGKATDSSDSWENF